VAATQPSSLSAPALYLSNWSDIIAIWISSRRAQTDDTHSGPRLAELHLLDGPPDARGVNQIVDYTGFFRDETRGVSYTDAHGFAPAAWFEIDPDNAGTLTTEYGTFNGKALDLDIRKSYVAVPNQPFIVARYSITNRGAAPVVFNVLDQLHLANLAGGDPARQVHAWYDAQRNALIADMSASGQFFVVLGAFEPPSRRPAPRRRPGSGSTPTGTSPTMATFTPATSTWPSKSASRSPPGRRRRSRFT
jgi:hypothetical protein